MEQSRFGNRLLASLPAESARRLVEAGRLVELPLRTPMFTHDEPARFVYFLTSGMASTVFTSERGTTIELSVQGSEGLVGWIHLLGDLPSSVDTAMQVPGSGYRVPIAAVQREFDNNAEIRRRMLEYVQHQSMVSNQIVACNRLHRAEERFARWLLMVQDRIGSDTLLMTQEFLSQMLGTRRTTVAEVAGELQRAGIIESRRGSIRVLNRALLESRSCECFRVVHHHFEALYGKSTEQRTGNRE
jgi:CRP-like cAMP-binding protein